MSPGGEVAPRIVRPISTTANAVAVPGFNERTKTLGGERYNSLLHSELLSLVF